MCILAIAFVGYGLGGGSWIYCYAWICYSSREVALRTADDPKTDSPEQARSQVPWQHFQGYSLPKARRIRVAYEAQAVKMKSIDRSIDEVVEFEAPHATSRWVEPK